MNILSFGSALLEKIISIPGLLIAITLHEVAHGYAAYLLGDTTAKNHGRLTLNPISHIDITGFLLLFLLGFGWAKPVPINPLYFKNRKLGVIIVSFAGPLTNFIIAIISVILLGSGIITNNIILDILKITMWYNIVLGVFNLLPFPPLDGSKIIASILPNKYEFLFYKYERYLYFILIILILSNTIDRVLRPLIYVAFNFLIRIMTFIY